MLPLLRNFYLSGGHTRSQCKHSLAKPCLSCELVCAAHCSALVSVPTVDHAGWAKPWTTHRRVCSKGDAACRHM